MHSKNTYIYFGTILEMLQNNKNIHKNVMNEHCKSNAPLSDDNKKKIKGDLFEIFANSHCFEKGHVSLISTYCKKNGYDGIYLNENNDIYFMESKYHISKFNVSIKDADKTISKKYKSRRHEIDNSRNALKDAKTNSKKKSIFTRKNDMTGENKKITIRIDENLTNSIWKLDWYLNSISSNEKEDIIKDEDKVFYLANNIEDDKLTINHDAREVICVTIREKEV